MQLNLLAFSRKAITIFMVLIALDLLMVILHLLFANYSTFFHLDFEQNLPTFYQSAKLIGFGGLFFMLSFSKKISTELKFFIIPLSLFITLLGLDELLQIHENIYRIFELIDWLHPSRMVTASLQMGYRSSLWLIYYIPIICIFIFWCGYWLRYFQTALKSNFWIILVCMVSFLSVLLAEILGSAGIYSASQYFGLITFEETAEMIFGSTLILIGLKALQKSHPTP